MYNRLIDKRLITKGVNHLILMAKVTFSASAINGFSIKKTCCITIDKIIER